MDERALTTQQRKRQTGKNPDEKINNRRDMDDSKFVCFFFFFDALHHGAAHQRGMHKTRHRER